MALAQLAEQAYRFERGDDERGALAPSYWDAAQAGLLAGERLLLDLQNARAAVPRDQLPEARGRPGVLAVARSIRAALVRLRETGECEFELPELFFDLFYPGHYRRRIEAVRLTIPCVTGPYTNVSATLTPLAERHPADARGRTRRWWRYRRGGASSIATSTAQNDAGVFELTFRDERYMPFEGAGAVSRWRLRCRRSFRQFDYQTINDVVLTVSYTAEHDALLQRARGGAERGGRG